MIEDIVFPFNTDNGLFDMFSSNATSEVGGAGVAKTHKLPPVILQVIIQPHLIPITILGSVILIKMWVTTKSK